MATGITEHNVWQAADELLLEGQRPTIERVRQKIGRGSPNTVLPYLDTWFKGLGARIRDPAAFSLASDVPDRVAQAAQHFWDAAMAEAREDICAQLDAQREQIERDRHALDQARQELGYRETAMTERVETLTEALALAHTQIEEGQRREAADQKARTAAEKRSEEVSAMLEVMREQHERARGVFDAERREADERSRLQEQHWLQELDRLRQDLKLSNQKCEEIEKKSKHRTAELQQHLEQAQKDNVALTAQLAGRQEDVQRLSAQRDEVKCSYDQSQSVLQTARTEIAQLRGALAEARRLRPNSETRRGLARKRRVRLGEH
jgi:chromosome segregation ATPase